MSLGFALEVLVKEFGHLIARLARVITQVFSVINHELPTRALMAWSKAGLRSDRPSAGTQTPRYKQKRSTRDKTRVMGKNRENGLDSWRASSGGKNENNRHLTLGRFGPTLS